MTRKTFLLAAGILGLIAATQPASAIECEGNFQIQKDGNSIASPFCQDGYLAIVANEYGMDVSGSDIRSNYGDKERACRLVGDDIRVSEACSQYRHHDFQRHIRH